jgi:hypothetical protein
MRATADELPVIDPEVRAAVAQGAARVLVELKLPGPDARSPREPAIAAAREAVLARLVGTRFRLVRRYTTVPLLVLEIGADALRALEGMSDVVARVRLDKARPLPAPQ